MIVTLNIKIREPILGQKNACTFAIANMTIDARPNTVERIMKALGTIEGIEIA